MQDRNDKKQNRNNEYSSLINDFEYSVFDNSLSDVGIDYAELSIDSFVTNEIIKEIPILKSIIAICKIGYNIHERNLYNQTLVFLDEFNSNKNSEKVNSHREKLKNNPQMLQDELGRILIILNRNIDIKKSKILAKLYAAYIDMDYDWETFCELSDITDKVFITDINYLKEVYMNNGIKDADKITHNHDRLISIGLLTNSQRAGGITYQTINDENLSENQGLNNDKQLLIEITHIGRKFCNAIFKP